jgi:hypothetical protein
VFPHSHVDEYNLEWACDDDEWCWYKDENTQLYCDNYGDCFEFYDALEEYFGGEYEHDLFSEIEEEMIWNMQVEMMNQGLPVENDGEFMEVFYPIYDQVWNSNAETADVNADWQYTWDLMWQPIWD